MPTGLLLLSAVLVSTPPGEIDFAYLSTYDTHVAVKTQIGHHLIRVDAHFADLAGERVFARVRCETQDPDAERPHVRTVHRVQTDIPMEYDNETWSFYFRVPRYDREKATCVIELGVKDPEEAIGDQVRIWHMFSLEPNGRGGFFFGKGDAVPPMAVVLVNEEGLLRKHFEPTQREALLSRKIIRQFSGVAIDGPRTARRIARRIASRN